MSDGIGPEGAGDSAHSAKKVSRKGKRSTRSRAAVSAFSGRRLENHRGGVPSMRKVPPGVRSRIASSSAERMPDARVRLSGSREGVIAEFILTSGHFPGERQERSFNVLAGFGASLEHLPPARAQVLQLRLFHFPGVALVSFIDSYYKRQLANVLQHPLVDA